MLFIAGASGSGKTSLIPHLRRLLPELEVVEFDSVGVPADADHAWRQRTTEAWIQRGLACQAEGREMLVVGHAQYGEVLACPSAPRLTRVGMCLLDCSDPVRIERICKRDGGSKWASMEMLGWASFQRMHAVDPQWYQQVLMDGGDASMQWQRWTNWQKGDPRWGVWVLDTSQQSLEDSAEQIAAWVRGLPADGFPWV
jgi:energy-coupling factor transporter ATP-binding protein EcfA2